MRCMHEASLYTKNCFITLTYEDLPEDGSLHLSHFQLFMKRLRKECGPGIRFFHCGEYGDKLGRPHYHACLFNWDFEDKIFLKMSPSGHALYTSKSLMKTWGHGHVYIGELTFQSAAYVARYIMKKYTNKDPSKVEAHYKGKKPEYVTMSRCPGIATKWFETFSSDLYPYDTIRVNGKNMKPAKFYDTLQERLDPTGFRKIKIKRTNLTEYQKRDNDCFRLSDKEKCAEARTKSLTRGFHNET